MAAAACAMNVRATATVNKPALGARRAMGNRVAVRGAGRKMVTASSRRVSAVTTAEFKVSDGKTSFYLYSRRDTQLLHTCLPLQKRNARLDPRSHTRCFLFLTKIIIVEREDQTHASAGDRRGVGGTEKKGDVFRRKKSDPIPSHIVFIIKHAGRRIYSPTSFPTSVLRLHGDLRFSPPSLVVWNGTKKKKKNKHIID